MTYAKLSIDGVKFITNYGFDGLGVGKLSDICVSKKTPYTIQVGKDDVHILHDFKEQNIGRAYILNNDDARQLIDMTTEDTIKRMYAETLAVATRKLSDTTKDF